MTMESTLMGFGNSLRKLTVTNQTLGLFGKSRLLSLLELFPNLTKVQKRHAKRKKGFATYVCFKTGTSKKEVVQRLGDQSHKSFRDFPKEEQKVEKRREDLGQNSAAASLKSSPSIRKGSSKDSKGDLSKSSEPPRTPRELKRDKQGPLKPKKEEENCDQSSLKKVPSSGTKKTVSVSEDKSKKTELLKKPRKSKEETMSRHPKPAKEMEGQGYIFHTYGRDRSRSGERHDQGRGESSRSQSRLPLWLSGNNSGRHTDQGSEGQSPALVQNLMGASFFTPSACGMMATTVPMPTAPLPSVPLVYGMDFPALSDVSSMLSQAQSTSGKSAKQLQKQQERANTHSEAFLSLNSGEDRSKIAPPPPPRQYKEPPSAQLHLHLQQRLTYESSGSTSRSKHTSHHQSSGGKRKKYSLCIKTRIRQCCC